MSDDSPRSSPPQSDESSEDEGITTNFGNHINSEPEGEDLYATAAADYRARPELDTYEDEGIDNSAYQPLSRLEIYRANQEINQRNSMNIFDPSIREMVANRRLEELVRPTRQEDDIRALLEDNDSNISEVRLNPNTGPLESYLDKPEIRVEIARKFKTFCYEFQDANKERLYMRRLETVANNNLESLEVSYIDLSGHNNLIGIWVSDAPDIIIPILSNAATALRQILYPNLKAKPITVRITDLPLVDNLSALRHSHMNLLIRTRGVVTRVGDTFPELYSVIWRCTRCNQVHGPFDVVGERIAPPSFCSQCAAKGPFEIDKDQTVFRSTQRITIQEPPSEIPPGSLPRTKEVILYDDLTRQNVRPGEELDITGVFKNVVRVRNTGFPVFSTIVEANYIRKSGDKFSAISITDEERRKIIELSKQPDIANRIFEAIAPSIKGYKDIKAAIALSLFGGTAIDQKDGHSVRGDINILILGDPGMAKSQFLKYAQAIAPRAVYTTGKGASAVGLTAGVRKDHMTGEWTIEGGALVLADGGVCLIDEFDKMSDKDRTSLHEAMEQQTITVTKAGVNTTLKARCSVIAACNPVGGSYRPSLSFNENSGLTDPIVSRFDIVCVLRDLVDTVKDREIADTVIRNHMGIDNREAELDQDLLRKYIAFARATTNPTVNQNDRNKIINLYTDMRKQSEEVGGQPIAVRNLESVIRLADAHARIHLRQSVNEDDVNFAIRLTIQSFLSTQKYAAQQNLAKRFQRYLVNASDKNDLLMHVLQTLIQDKLTFYRLRRGDFNEEEIIITKDEFERLAREKGIDNASDFYTSSMFRTRFESTDKEIIFRQ